MPHASMAGTSKPCMLSYSRLRAYHGTLLFTIVETCRAVKTKTSMDSSGNLAVGRNLWVTTLAHGYMDTMLLLQMYFRVS